MPGDEGSLERAGVNAIALTANFSSRFTLFGPWRTLAGCETAPYLTPTVASTTNLQSFPLNGGELAVSVSLVKAIRARAFEISQLLGVRRARIFF
jgi:hypothetical protein